jgi:6,7-dimethyl-8-ribityllumazine synthase
MPVSVGVVAADFNKALVDAMADEATRAIEAAGARLAHLARVPGAYEAPLVADALLTRPDIDAVVVLGHIERGETLHGEVMGHVVCAALVEMQIRHRKPVGIGIIGPGADQAQAEARKLPSARAAVNAVLRSLEALHALRR